MTGARFVHDALGAAGLGGADRRRPEGQGAGAAGVQDRQDRRARAGGACRIAIWCPAIWLPDPRVRRERELARFRLHLVKHRSMLKHRIHSTLITFGQALPGQRPVRCRRPRAAGSTWRSRSRGAGPSTPACELIDDLEAPDRRRSTGELRASGADHPYVPLLLTAPGIGWVLAFTIAAEIGEIERFASPQEARRLHRALPARDTSPATATAAAR